MHQNVLQHVHLLGVLASSFYSVCITYNNTFGSIDSPSLVCCWYAAVLADCQGKSVCAERFGRAVQKQIWTAHNTAAATSRPAEVCTLAFAADHASSIQTCFRFCSLCGARNRAGAPRSGIVLAATNPMLFKPSWCDLHNSTSQLYSTGSAASLGKLLMLC